MSRWDGSAEIVIPTADHPTVGVYAGVQNGQFTSADASTGGQSTPRRVGALTTPPPPTIDSFTASPISVLPNQQSRLQWATSNAGTVAAGQYRQRFSNGEAQGSGSINYDSTGHASPGTLVRGHVTGAGTWDIDENWRSGLAMRVDLIDGFLPSHPDAIWADAEVQSALFRRRSLS